MDGKIVNTQRRKYCYDCSPFGSGNDKNAKCETIRQEKVDNLSRKKRECYSKHQKKLRAERKATLVEMLGGVCIKCGYSQCLAALDFHHKDPNTKSFELSTVGYTASWDRLVEEVKKCELLCCRCHRELEAGMEL